MPLLSQFKRFQVYEPLDDSEALELQIFTSDFGQYLYWLQFNHAMFQSVVWRERMIMLISNCELQIDPPKIPYKKCLLEVIGKLENTTLDFELSADELECITELPMGWRLSELYGMTGYRSEPLPEINLEAIRLCWYMGAPDPIEANDCWFIHPSQHRPLTGPEWDAITAASGDAALLAWLAAVDSRPDPPGAAERGKAERREGNSGVIDFRPLAAFPALSIYPYPEPRKPAPLFNVNPDGSLRVPWELISNRNQGRITHANELQTIEDDSAGVFEEA